MRRPRALAALTLALAVLGTLLVPASAQAATPVGIGTWENTSSKISYKGSWKKQSSKRDSGGSSSVLGKTGYAQLTFATTGIRWTARTNRYSGIADVYLDGAKTAQVDLYTASTQVKQTVYEIGGLAEGTHVLKLVRTGKKNAKSTGTGIQIDTLQTFAAPDVTPPAAPTGLSATAAGADVALAWSANPEPDVITYRVYRRVGASTSRTLVATTASTVRTAVDPDRPPGQTSTYDVVAVDRAGNTSGYSASASVTTKAVQGQGTYENDNLAVTYKGPWSTVASTSDSGGSSASLNAAGYAQLAFSTSGLRWIARKDQAAGIAAVYLDGAKVATVDLYATSARPRQVAYEVKGLSGSAHTLRIAWTGTKNKASTGTGITLDAFVAPDVVAPKAPTGLKADVAGTAAKLGWSANGEPDLEGYRVYRREDAGTTRTLVATVPAGTTSLTDPGLAPGTTYVYDLVAVDTSGNASALSGSVSAVIVSTSVGAGTYQNGDPAVTLKGAWQTITDPADSGGSRATLKSAGYAQIGFSTGVVRWVTRSDKSSGIADVYLDGVKRASVDLYAATTKTQQVGFQVDGLPAGDHVLKIVWTGTKNAASSGTGVTLDAIVAPDLVPPAVPSGLKVTAAGTAAKLSWSANAEPDLKAYRVYRREDAGTTRTLVATVPAGTTSLTDPGLAPGTTYVYDLVAVDATGNASASSDSASAVIGSTSVGAGTYQNGDPAVTLKGAWQTSTDPADSGGSRATLKSAGYAQVGFSTTGIRWVTRADKSSGIAQVYLDGVKKPDVDLYSATTKTQQVGFQVDGLPAGDHVLKIVWTGTKNTASSGTGVTLDAIIAPDAVPPAVPVGVTARSSGNDVAVSWTANTEPDLKGYQVFRRDDTGASRVLVGMAQAGETSLTDTGRTPGATYSYDVAAIDTAGNVSDFSAAATVTIAVVAEGAGTYEDDSSSVTLDGDWSTITSRNDSGGTYASLNSSGFAQVSFTTSGIRWIGRVNNYSGIADVYLDGVKQTSVDLYSATTKARQVLYEAKGLAETTHTLRVVRSGTKDDSSRSYTISVDSFVAPDIYPPSAPTGLMATPLTASVGLAWTASPEPDVAGYRIFRGDETGSLSLVSTTQDDDTDDVDDGLRPGATYRYQVSAIDGDGNESLRSPITTVTVPVAPLPAGTYQDDSADFVRQGGWTKASSGGSNTDSGGGFSTLNGDGYAEITFGTSGIRWLARRNSYSGTADVYLDGVKKATVDLYAPTTQYAQNVFELTGLSETGHTLRIVRTGDKNPSSTGRVITLDAFVAPDVYPPSVPTAVSASPVRTGATITWRKSPERDVASYAVYRRADGSGSDVLVGTTDPRTTTLTDVGLANAAGFSWRVLARDTTGNSSALSAAADLTTGVDPYVAYPYRYATCPPATVTVSNRSQLLSAIAAAKAGTVIVLRPGQYGSDYLITTKATADAPLWICGPRSAIFDGGDVTKGYGLKVNAANYLVLAGMTVRNVQKGVSVQYGKFVTIADLRVEQIGDEAIHLKNQTKDSTVIGNSIDTTGLHAKNYGEGVYIGTAQGNWCVYNNCQPDTSDRNVVAFNDIRNNTAEDIEAKAATNDGAMWKNTLDGAGIVADDADSLIQVMGSGWMIAGNVGSHVPTASDGDAIQVWNTDDGSYGLDNVVYANAVTDDLKGYVVRFPYVDAGNVVGCDNTMAGKGLGRSNRPCQN